MEHLLSVQNISKSYANHVALKDVSLDIPKGSIYGLLGPNGAGKTSLIRIINQITGPDTGQILFDGKPLQSGDEDHIGYLPEERGLYKKMKVGEQAMYLAQLKGMSKTEAMNSLKEWFIKFEIEGWWNKKVEELSKGMAQKIQFIVTVLHRPKLLILDEPFSGFDPINTNLIKQEILNLNKEGATIIFSTHNMASVEEVCSHVALINNSQKILEGSVSDVKQEFKQNEFEVIFKGSMIKFTNALWTNFELISSEQDGEVTTARVKLLNGNSTNALLESVLPHVDVYGLKEILPSMNDIFIQKVTQVAENTNLKKTEMGKIGLIIQREYLSRVKKKSFIIMTLLGPVLMVALIGGIIWFSQQENEAQNIMVVEDKGPVFTKWSDSEGLSFEHLGTMSESEAKKLLNNSNYTSLLYLHSGILDHGGALFFYKTQPSMFALKKIENQVEGLIEKERLKVNGIDPRLYKKVRENINMISKKLTESGEEEELMNEQVIVGFVFGLMVYLFIFFYGIQVMRGVIEEKTNRIVEVIITSVEPFQLMMGKIIGIALVGLTQFVILGALSSTLLSGTTSYLMSQKMDSYTETLQQTTNLASEQSTSNNIIAQKKVPSIIDLTSDDHILNRINWPLMLGVFVFYFLGGYLLYAALFAAIGSAVDSETDTQQFMLPVTLPLLGAYILSAMMINNPEGSAAVWGSLIPFTSPIIMPMRVAVGMDGQGWQLILSMILLVVTFIGTTWLAGKIYRTGILMYGKKVNYKELWKWIRFSK